MSMQTGCPARVRRGRAPGFGASRGFSLIELLIVIAVIAVLVSLTVVVGATVASGSKKTATLSSIQILQAALGNYQAEVDDIPPALIRNPSPGPSEPAEGGWLPVVDGTTRQTRSWNPNTPKAFNSVGYFMLQASDVAGNQEMFEAVDPKFLTFWTAVLEPPQLPRPGLPFGPIRREPEMATMLDAWGNPLRYVHPRFHGILVREDPRPFGRPGAQMNLIRGRPAFLDFFPGRNASNQRDEWLISAFRRNRMLPEEFEDGNWAGRFGDPRTGDSDGGLTSNGVPYFYSAGPDGNPSTLEDNVYAAVPQFVEPNVTGGP